MIYWVSIAAAINIRFHSAKTLKTKDKIGDYRTSATLNYLTVLLPGQVMLRFNIMCTQIATMLTIAILALHHLKSA